MELPKYAQYMYIKRETHTHRDKHLHTYIHRHSHTEPYIHRHTYADIHTHIDT